LRSDPAAVFRAGVRLVLGFAVALAALAYWREGWSGSWRVIAAFFEPAAVLALAPLVFLVGAARIGLVRLFRALFKEP
jgi:hypothetical protein